MKKSLHAPIMQVALAVIALFFGVFVYLLDNQPERIFFIPQWLANTVKGDSLIGQLDSYLPTFVHVYAFVLLTMAIVFPIQQYRRYLVPVCAFWFSIDSLLEITQLNVVASQLPHWFDGVLFLKSTFDVMDFVSIGLGALAAFYTVAVIDNVYVDDGTGEVNPK